jgi:hypothetical protein
MKKHLQAFEQKKKDEDVTKKVEENTTKRLE